MNQFKQVLAYLDVHRAKIASVVGAVAAFVAVHQGDLTSGDKTRVVSVIGAALVMYLRGNSSYEAIKLQLEASQKVR